MMSLESTQILRRLMLYMPCPHQLTSQSFKSSLGIVTYLSPFISGLSTLTAPMCELLKNDAEYSWDASYQTACQHVKDAVVSDTTLWYFDASCPITVQVDASQIRLGAALLQNNKPVAFSSKVTDWSWMLICQHWKWDVSCCLWSWTVVDLCLW